MRCVHFYFAPQKITYFTYLDTDVQISSPHTPSAVQFLLCFSARKERAVSIS